ncbi:MAG: agmatine deiminase family protein [Flavobacteriales bacterium]|nr:agmatine deiminase family protein [Flavobacteriales bacterium]
MKRLSTLSVLALVSLSVLAQEERSRPHALAPWEVPLIREYRDSRATASRGITSLPTLPVRTMAEWEEVQSLCITWTDYDGILKQIVRAAKEECEVIIVCADSTSVIAYLNNSQFGGPLNNLNNITFIEGDFDSIWMRDYGPESMYVNEVDSLVLMDWIYNRPRPLDDLVPDLLGNAKGIPVLSSTVAPNDLVHTGGNFMADGFGTAFSSDLVIDENGSNGDYNQSVHSAAQTDQLMTDWMGIQPGRYIRMQTLPYDGIHHIDMHMKLIDEERLLVGEFPQGISDGPQLEANLQDITANYNSVFNTPYEYVRIPMPSSTGGQYPPSASYRTYANNVFINGTILVPTYRTQFDTVGLRILRESQPGYNVIGIDCDDNGMNIISQSGAIHCITKAIGVSDPLLIKHQSLDDTYDTQNPYTVEAYIRHRSGISGAMLYWTTDTTQAYQSLAMSDIGGNNWSASIPAQAAGTEVFYYIQGTANSGKVQVRPIVAPEGYWSFRVLDSNTGIAGANAPVVLEVFPNPTDGQCMIALAPNRVDRTRVEVLDALGRRVAWLNEGFLPGDGRFFVDLGPLDAGTYYVVATSAGGRHVLPLVKR